MCKIEILSPEERKEQGEKAKRDFLENQRKFAELREACKISVLGKEVDLRDLLMTAASLTHRWHDDKDKDAIRKDFADFAKEKWIENGHDESYIVSMQNHYVYNDTKSIVEYMYNLDAENQVIALKWLLYHYGWLRMH